MNAIERFQCLDSACTPDKHGGTTQCEDELTTLNPLQEGSWFQDFEKAEEMLQRATREAHQLSESIAKRNTGSDHKPIIEKLQSLIAPLNERVIQAV